jgi:hypothetical protein
MKGLEPPRRKALDPKSSASTNSATSAFDAANLFFFLENVNGTGKMLILAAISVRNFYLNKHFEPVHLLLVHRKFPI